MIHEYRIYMMDPAMLPGYLELVEAKLQTLRRDRYGRLLGFWTSKFCSSSQVHHLWEYESLNQRQDLRQLLAAQVDWRDEFLEQARPAIRSQEISFLLPSVAIKPPEKVSLFYEMRRYQSVVGQAGTLLEKIKNRPIASGQKMVGLWMCESPDPNEVFELLASRELVTILTHEENCSAHNLWLQGLNGLLLGTGSTMLCPMGVSPLC